MKNVTILSILFTLAFFSSNGQIVLLKVNNPFPRIGDECEITYQIKKDTMEVSDTKSFEEQMKELRNKDLGEGTFKVTKLITNPGSNTFGPFIFYVNNNVIKSDTIKIHFDNPLPNETRGVWIRQLFHNGQEYLIIEQRVSGEWVTTKTSNNSISTEFKKDSPNWLKN